jgi:hypothetical protein
MARLVGINHVAVQVGDIGEMLEFLGNSWIESSCAVAAGTWRSSTSATSSSRSSRRPIPSRRVTTGSSSTTRTRSFVALAMRAPA